MGLGLIFVVAMVSEVETVSRVLGVSKEDLIRRGVRAYLEMELRKVNSELLSLYSKYDVKSLGEMDKKINKGKLSETGTFDDFTKLDYLESLRDKIERLLGELS